MEATSFHAVRRRTATSRNCRTLAVHAQIILADEPTGNLDTENSTQIIQLLSRLAHEENCCVVVVTHDLEVAKAADVVFRMDSGRLKEETV